MGTVAALCLRDQQNEDKDGFVPLALIFFFFFFFLFSLSKRLPRFFLFLVGRRYCVFFQTCHLLKRYRLNPAPSDPSDVFTCPHLGLLCLSF